MMQVKRSTTPQFIPARAGPTCPASSASITWAAHPRLCGAYVAHIEGVEARCRPIPARAGPTERCRRLLEHGPSRPRRAYCILELWDRIGGGLSPFARGLLASQPDLSTGARSIPARAGPTLTSTASECSPLPESSPQLISGHPLSTVPQSNSIIPCIPI
jgi:hypothetical protein